ncbi:MAG: hypothetical protein ACXIT9_00840 [Nitritalea sp.]
MQQLAYHLDQLSGVSPSIKNLLYQRILHQPELLALPAECPIAELSLKHWQRLCHQKAALAEETRRLFAEWAHLGVEVIQWTDRFIYPAAWKQQTGTTAPFQFLVRGAVDLLRQRPAGFLASAGAASELEALSKATFLKKARLYGLATLFFVADGDFERVLTAEEAAVQPCLLLLPSKQLAKACDFYAKAIAKGSCLLIGVHSTEKRLRAQAWALCDKLYVSNWPEDSALRQHLRQQWRRGLCCLLAGEKAISWEALALGFVPVNRFGELRLLDESRRDLDSFLLPRANIPTVPEQIGQLAARLILASGPKSIPPKRLLQALHAPEAALPQLLDLLTASKDVYLRRQGTKTIIGLRYLQRQERLALK